jgi:1,4-alpha-glucan branching enzyme
MPFCCRWREVLNTDSAFYGGANNGNVGGRRTDPIPWHDQPQSAEFTLPPLGVLWLTPDAAALADPAGLSTP